MTDTQHNRAVPYHLGIIPDGNRHRRGLAVSREIALAAFDRGVKVFTMYVFSTENWRRTEDEVGYLMDIFYGFVTREYRQLEDRHVRFRFAGSRDRLSSRLLKAIDELELRTAEMTAGTVVMCLNYGGHQEIADAAASIVRSGVAAEAVTPELVDQHMYVPEVPGIDLIIRTSNEQRLSGFMLWRSDYAELAFIDTYWPAFEVSDLEAALAQYADRQRRFGK